MKRMKVGIVLLALLLAAMAMVPCVSAKIEQDSKDLQTTIIESNYVPLETAQEHAHYALIEFASSGALGEKDTWIGSRINPDPLMIHDIDGSKLFYLFTIEKNNQKIGEIKIAATKIIGTSVISIGSSNISIDLPRLEMKVRSEAKKYAKPGSPITTQLVYYADPKIGMAADYTDATTDTQQKVIIDAYDYYLVPDHVPQYEGDKGMVSYYKTSLSDKYSAAIDSWSRDDDAIKKVEKSVPQMKVGILDPISEKILNDYSTYQSSSKARTEYRLLSPFPLYGGETTEWCTVATAKMISGWYGISRTQTAIAGKMGIPTSPPYRGATINEELNYYQSSTTSGGLGKTNSIPEYRTYWYDSKEEINAGRPFKVGNQGHARAVDGYKRDPNDGKTYFHFEDPAPLNVGHEEWLWFDESDPHFYNNHIYIK